MNTVVDVHRRTRLIVKIEDAGRFLNDAHDLILAMIESDNYQTFKGNHVICISGDREVNLVTFMAELDKVRLELANLI